MVCIKALNFTVVFIGALLFASSVVCAGDKTEIQENVIVVSATGEVEVKPDIVNINVGITTIEPKVDDCFAKNNDVMNSVKKALKKYGILDKDIQTANYSLMPQYDYQKPGKKIRGYRLQHTFSTVVKDIDKIGKVLTDVVDAGANDISRISFTTDKLEDAQMQAREKAVKTAEKKAAKLAESAGVKLGKVVRIEEVSGAGPMPIRKFEVQAMSARVSEPPIAPGELNVRIPVVVYFAIAD